jgi:hypothetical protein
MEIVRILAGLARNLQETCKTPQNTAFLLVLWIGGYLATMVSFLFFHAT